MALLQFMKVAKYANLRAVVLGIMGAVSLLFPDFLAGGMIYVIAVYAILNGALGIVDFILERHTEKKTVAYFNVTVAGVAIVCGILCIIYFRYLVSSLPVFFGALLMIEGIVHFATAICSKSKLKPLLVLIAIAIAFGGVATVLFSFGFGGLLTLSRMFGGLLLLSCISELLIYLTYKKDCQA